MSSRDSDHATSHLLALPPELRLRIYEIILNRSLSQKKGEDCSIALGLERFVRMLWLAFTCRKLYEETREPIKTIKWLEFDASYGTGGLDDIISIPTVNSITEWTILTPTGVHLLRALPHFHSSWNLLRLHIKRLDRDVYQNPEKWLCLSDDIKAELAQLPRLQILNIVQPTEEDLEDAVDGETEEEVRDVDVWLMGAVAEDVMSQEEYLAL